jgi:hypothetical protein
MGELRPRDQVFNENGLPCNVVATTEVMIGHPCYRVEFNDGTQIIADANHEWLTHTAVARTSWRNTRDNDRLGGRDISKSGTDQSHKRAMPSIITTREIAATLLVAEKAYLGKTNHSIPVCGPLTLPDAVLPIDPYVLGAWLGDGHSRSASITSNDMQIIGEIAKTGVRITKRADKYVYGMTGGLQSVLSKQNLLKNKHIPAQYMRASFDQRRSLLQGLMDTDGYVTPYGRCEFTSTRRALAEQVLELVISCGIQAKMICGVAMLNGKDCGPKYRITFTPEIQVFRLNRKAKLIQKAISCRIKHRFIVGCELIPSVPVRCIQVDSPSCLYLASHAMIPTHNSTFLNQVMLEAIMAGEKVCIASYEMTPGRTLHRLVIQAVGTRDIDQIKVVTALETLGENLLVHSHMGQIKAERIIALFKEQADQGVTQFVVDSLMKCGLDEEDYNGQKRIADALQSFAQSTGAHVHLVAHPRKGMNEHEIPGKMDIKGTGTITDMADNVFTVWRNKEKSDLMELYESGEPLPKGKDIITVKGMRDSVLACSKCREEPEAEGKYGLYFQRITMQFHDTQFEAPYDYLRNPEESSRVRYPTPAGIVDAKTLSAGDSQNVECGVLPPGHGLPGTNPLPFEGYDVSQQRDCPY